MDGSGINITITNFSMSIILFKEDWKPFTSPRSDSSTFSMKSWEIVRSAVQTPEKTRHFFTLSLETFYVVDVA